MVFIFFFHFHFSLIIFTHFTGEWHSGAPHFAMIERDLSAARDTAVRMAGYWIGSPQNIHITREAFQKF